jgi:membrane protein DedA with SNARE-associated domain
MISMATLQHLLINYGYLAVLLVVALESMGIPAPGETILLVAAVTAGTTRALSLPLVIAAAASGAIVGDNLGYWMGSSGGTRLFHRYGHLIRLNERKLKLGVYLFQRHGGKVVFFGRFVMVLRMWAAFLAGMHQMRWTRFLCYNALGGILWASSYGIFGYLLGTNVYQLTGPLGLVLLGLAVCVTTTLFLLLRRSERHWEAEAERLLPGSLEQYVAYAETGRKEQQEQQARMQRNHTQAPLPRGRGRRTVAGFSPLSSRLAWPPSSTIRVEDGSPAPSRRMEPDTPSPVGKRLHPIRLKRFLANGQHPPHWQ